MTVELDHLSYSSLSLYQSCPRAWRYRYVEKIPTSTSPALIFGSAMHATIEHVVKANLANEPVDACTVWQEKWGEVSQQPVEWDGELPEAMSNDGYRLIGCAESKELLSSLAPLVVDGEPVIEKRVELKVPGVPVPIVGFIDMISADGVPADFKTSKNSWAKGKAELELQPAFYLAALNQEGFDLNPDMRFRHYVWVKTKTPQVQVLEHSRTIRDIFWLFGLILETWRAIDSGNFPPSTASWMCSDRMCDYWGLCRGK